MKISRIVAILENQPESDLRHTFPKKFSKAALYNAERFYQDRSFSTFTSTQIFKIEAGRNICDLSGSPLFYYSLGNEFVRAIMKGAREAAKFYGEASL